MAKRVIESKNVLVERRRGKKLIPIDILAERLQLLESVLGSEEAVGDVLGVTRRTVGHWRTDARAINKTALLLLEEIENQLLRKDIIERLRKKFPSLRPAILDEKIKNRRA